MLVPEIALTPQTVRRFTARFKRVAILHSGLTATERHRFWQQISTGMADVVVGARSAVFAPLPDLGMIVVDEEHESSYKQDQAPRYHAPRRRDQARAARGRAGAARQRDAVAGDVSRRVAGVRAQGQVQARRGATARPSPEP